MSLKYEIFRAETIEALEVRVQDLIDEGWHPQGGVSVGVRPCGESFYIQAMILVGEDEES